MTQITMYQGQVNSPECVLTNPITAITTTIEVTGDIATKLQPAPNIFVIGTDESAETIYYPTAATGSGVTWTFSGVTRALQGTAILWAAGSPVARLFTAYDHNTFKANIEDLSSGKAPLSHKHSGIIIASSTATASEKASADYVCDGIADDVEINAAIQSRVSRVIHLTSGTFTITQTISFDYQYMTFEGEGDNNTILNFTATKALRGEQENLIFRNFKITGKGCVEIWYNHVKHHNITVTADNTVQSAFYAYLAGSTLEDVEYINCTAIDCNCWGFQVNAQDTGNLIKNWRYFNCQAINCGTITGINEYITGFAFNESGGGGVDIEDVIVYGCLAEGCYESGFHIESNGTKKRVIFSNCISKGNGTKTSPTFGAGFLIPNGDVLLVGCISEANGKDGFMVGDDIKLRGCTCKSEYRRGYYIMGTNITLDGCLETDSGESGFMIEGGDQYITLSNCYSYNSNKPLWVVYGNNIVVTGFNAINIATGDYGGSICLGDASPSNPSSNNYFDLHLKSANIYGIYIREMLNTIITGSILSTGTIPLYLFGDLKHLTIRDMDITSVGSSVGSGIYIGTATNISTVDIRNCVIRDTATTPTLEYGIYNSNGTVPKTTNCSFFGPTIANTYQCGQTTSIAHGRTSVTLSSGNGTITHGLGTTPTWAILTCSTSGDSANISSFSSTTISLHVTTAAGGNGTTQYINWMCGV